MLIQIFLAPIQMVLGTLSLKSYGMSASSLKKVDIDRD